MSLDSTLFVLVFAPGVIALAALLRHWAPRLVPAMLLVASGLFYALAVQGTLWLVPALTVLNCLTVQLIISRPWMLPVAVVAHLLPLILWKYGGAGPIPLGLSFVTFLHVSALFDVRAGTPMLSPIRHMLYSGFFASVTAGPITRYRDLAPQLLKLGMNPVPFKDLLLGLSLFTIGMAKIGLIGQPLQSVVQDIVAALAHGDAPSTVEAWYIFWGGFLSLYFLFSGYSDLAIALGLTLGIRLAQNFDSPLKAESAAAFIERWHMSLMAWVRDYFFANIVRLVRGLNVGTVETRAIFGWAVGTISSLTVIGAWHGNTALFILGGALGGLAVIAAELPRTLGYRVIPGPRWLGRTLLLLALFGFGMINQIPDYRSLEIVIWAMIDPEGLIIPTRVASWIPGAWLPYLQFGDVLPNSDVSTKFAAGHLVLGLLVTFALPNSMQIAGISQRGISGWMRWKPNAVWGLLLGLLAITTVLTMTQSTITGFIYDEF